MTGPRGVGHGGIARTYPQPDAPDSVTLDPIHAPFRGGQGFRVETWWRDGCPGGLTPRAWFMALPAWLLTWVALALAFPSASFLVWALNGLSGFIVAGLVMLLGDQAIRVLAPRLKTVATIVVWVTAGAFGFTTTMVLGDVMALAPKGSPIAGVLVSAAFAVAWFPVGGRFAHAVQTDARSRAVLLRQLARERALALESAQLVEADRRRLVQQTEEVVSEQLRKATVLSADPMAAAVALQTVVDEVVRPLSRELERGDVQEQALVEAVQTMGAVSPRALGEFRSALARPGLGVVATTLLRVAISVSIVFGLNDWRPLGPATLAVLGVIAGYTVVASALFLLAFARAQASAEDLSRAVENAEWAASRLRQLAWSERERLGRSIHGDAQARIVATALQIQLGHHDDIDQRVQELEQDIRALLGAGEDATDWRVVWERILRVWEYSIEVHALIAPEAAARLDDDAVAAHAVVSVMREAVTNSVRHGHARNIDIEVALDHGDMLRMVIADDGTTADKTGAPGLGSRTLDSVCLEWHLSMNAIGHTLIARIPTRGGVVHA